MKSVKSSTIDGTVVAPPSKSMMLRAVAIAVLSGGETKIYNPSFCDDSRAALRIAESLGLSAEWNGTYIAIKEEKVARNDVLDCGESGLCIRMFAPIAALSDAKTVLTGSGSVIKRPISMVVEPLRELGVQCDSNAGFPPVTLKGPLEGGTVHVDGSVSSQFLTGLLMALPLAKADSRIWVSDLESRPYVDVTLDLLAGCGVVIERHGYEEFVVAGNQAYTCDSFTVEGDWSGASFLLVAGALGGKARVLGLRAKSRQPDRAIIEVLHMAGARVEIDDDEVVVERGTLRSFDFDVRDCPDLFPPLVALACHCEGLSRISGVRRLRYKESDRLSMLTSEFSKLGARMRVRDEAVEIDGAPLNGGIVDSHGDHRLAMAYATAAIRATSAITIEGAECVSKSYPNFFESLINVGGTVDE